MSRDSFRLWRALVTWLDGDAVAAGALVAFVVIAVLATLWVALYAPGFATAP